MSLDPATCWVFIPLAAVVMGIGSAMLKAYFAHQEQMASLKLARTSDSGMDALTELQQLKQELARLRDTTTQYDLSIQQTLEEVQQRLSEVESRDSNVGSTKLPAYQPPTPVDNVLRSG